MAIHRTALAPLALAGLGMGLLALYAPATQAGRTRGAASSTPSPWQPVRARVLEQAARLPRHTDKVVHAGVFATTTLAALTLLPHRWVAWASLAHACVAESVQKRLPGRTADPADTAANVVGVGLGVAAWRWLAATKR